MMTSATQPASKAMLWTGRIMTVLPILVVLFGSITKLMKLAAVMDGFARAGISASLVVPVGLIELICVVVYAIPRTSVLGAILMTGLLGGAVMTTLRIGDPIYLPIVCGLLAWGGLFFRDERLRELIPLRRAETRNP